MYDIYLILVLYGSFSDEVLKVLTAEVSVAVEKHVGREEYADKMKSVISRSSNKRAERKKRQAVEVTTFGLLLN